MNVIALPTFSYLVWEERERDGKREGWEGVRVVTGVRGRAGERRGGEGRVRGRKSEEEQVRRGKRK